MHTVLDLAIRALTACAAAFQFLTRLPIPILLHYDDALFRRSVIFYPLVGAMLGLLLSGVGLLLRGYGLPEGWGFQGGVGSSGVIAALLLVLWVAVTGALHLDGLMDTADGVFSHRGREQMLEIMKDSRVGAMGVIACMLLLLCKWVMLQQWLTLPGRTFAYMLPVTLLWSRWYMVVAIACWPYARAEQGKRGLGSFFRGIGLKHLSVHTALAVCLSLLLTGGYEGEWMLGQALIATGVALFSTLLIGAGMSMYLNRKLGGLTGDTYGAMNEVVETALLLIVYMVIR